MEKHNSKSYIKGVIDIGTNTTRLFIAEVNNLGIQNKIQKRMEITRLGEDVDKNRVLKDIAMDRTLNTLREYAEEMNKFNVVIRDACATSATRDSDNRDFFIDKVKTETGIEIRCISGETEAEYCFKGAMSDLDEDIILIDIGGGSTEIISGNRNRIEFLRSFNVGSVRVKEKFFKNEDYHTNLNAAKNFTYDMIREAGFLKEKKYKLVGVAGTVTTQVEVKEKLLNYNTDIVHGYNLTINDIVDNLNLFHSLPLEERKNIPGLHPKRAEVIISGTLILKWIMEFFGKTEIYVSENDILEGIMLNNKL